MSVDISKVSAKKLGMAPRSDLSTGRMVQIIELFIEPRKLAQRRVAGEQSNASVRHPSWYAGAQQSRLAAFRKTQPASESGSTQH
jgi:hypothetical protein